MKIAIVGYKDFIDLTKNIIQTFEGVEIKVYRAFLTECLPLISILTDEGFDAVLTGEANATYLKKLIDIPVLTFKITYSDLLSAISLALNYGTNIGVAISSFENQCFNWKPFEDLLGIQVTELSYTDIQQLREKVVEAKKQNGLSSIIGTTVAVSVAKEYDLPGFMIYSIQDTVRDAINRATELITATRKEQEKSQQFETIIDFINDGVIAIDNHGNIKICNNSARKMLCMSKEQVIDRHVTAISDNGRLSQVLESGRPQLDQIEHVGTTPVVINRVPIVVKNNVLGVVAAFHDVTKIQELEKKIESVLRAKGLTAKSTFRDITGNSPEIHKTIAIAKKFASGNATILIIGETGSGKEIFAQSIHNYSPRKGGPFVAVNCGALPENLLESELFGYEEGAFTGTRKSGKKGLFELAHHGTIFLDEINSTPLAFQSRLLRVMQEREIMRLGSDKIIPIDVRVIAATNEELSQSVVKKEFRADLYYRLNVLKLYIPPLHKRREDIYPLFSSFLTVFNPGLSKRLEQYLPVLLKPLENYDFPGNVRELSGIVERFITLLDPGESENIAYLKRLLAECMDEYIVPELHEPNQIVLELKPDLKETLLSAERQIILHYLACGGKDKTRLAKELGIGRTTLYRKIRTIDSE